MLRSLHMPVTIKIMRAHRLIAFFVLTFILSWGIGGILLLLSWRTGNFDTVLDRHSPMYYLFFWAPAFSALIVVAATQGRDALVAYLLNITRLRFKWRWWTAVLVGVPILKLLAWGLAEDPSPPGMIDAGLPYTGFVWAGLLTAAAVPVGEIGWRGFALPLLQRRVNGLVAALIIGVIWCLWYMPWLLPGTVMNWSLSGDSIPAIVRFFAGGIALSVTATVIYNGVSGSVPLAFVFVWLNGYPHMWETGTHVAYVDTVITLTTAVILVFVLRRRYLAQRNLYTGIAVEARTSDEP